MSGEIGPNDQERTFDLYRSPDYKFWCRLPFWTTVELTYLSFGFDPLLMQGLSAEDRNSEPEVWYAIESRYFLISRHIEANQFSEKNGPLAGIEFLLGIGEEVFGPLASYLERYADQRTNLAGLCSMQAKALQKMSEQVRMLTAELEATEDAHPQAISGLKNKLQKAQAILAGVAMAQYRFRPNAARNKAASQIVEDCRDVGLSVSDDTVRNNLREGAEQFDFIAEIGED